MTDLIVYLCVRVAEALIQAAAFLLRSVDDEARPDVGRPRDRLGFR